VTDKHLALVSQSLLLLQRVVPLLKAALARHMSSRQHLLLQEFDRRVADLELHNGQLCVIIVLYCFLQPGWCTNISAVPEK
jgi:hypothetical protein